MNTQSNRVTNPALYDHSIAHGGNMIGGSMLLNKTANSYWMKKTFKAFYPNASYCEAIHDQFPKNFDELKYWFNTHHLHINKSLPIFTGNCEQTIYATPADNICFRAWHDFIHLDLDQDFEQGEFLVAEKHIEQLRAMKAPNNVINAIYMDTIGQYLYHSITQEHCTKQEDFVTDCLLFGLDFVLGKVRLGKRY